MWKRSCLLLFVFGLLLCCCGASLQWNASIPDETHGAATGYRIHRGTAPGVYDWQIDVGNTLTWPIPDDLFGSYYWTASAYNDAGSSGYSNEVFWQRLLLGASNLISSKLEVGQRMAQGFITQQSDRTTPSESAFSVGVPNKYIYGQKFTVPANASTVTEMGAYCDNSGTGGGGTFRMALYSVDVDGDLDNLIAATSTEQDPPTTAGWVEWTGLSIDISAYQSQTVAIVVWPDDALFDFELGLSTGTDVEYYNAGSLTNWEWPDLNGNSTAFARTLGIYAVYTTSGASAVPVFMYHYMNH